MSIEVKVPTLGESVSEATVGQWLKKPGETVALDEPIVSLETDKVAVEVPSPVAGVLGQLSPKVRPSPSAPCSPPSKLAALLLLRPLPPPRLPPRLLRLPSPRWPPPARRCREQRSAVLSPAVRRAVLEYGIDPATVKGTGKDGRLTKEDVLAAARPRPPRPLPPPFGPGCRAQQ
jgi:2-oxoglutarate dehydrogenase E2 component (dihydrolipoamide succinyltransferase)